MPLYVGWRSVDLGRMIKHDGPYFFTADDDSDAYDWCKEYLHSGELAFEAVDKSNIRYLIEELLESTQHTFGNTYTRTVSEFVVLLREYFPTKIAQINEFLAALDDFWDTRAKIAHAMAADPALELTESIVREKIAAIFSLNEVSDSRLKLYRANFAREGDGRIHHSEDAYFASNDDDAKKTYFDILDDEYSPDDKDWDELSEDEWLALSEEIVWEIEEVSGYEGIAGLVDHIIEHYRSPHIRLNFFTITRVLRQAFIDDPTVELISEKFNALEEMLEEIEMIASELAMWNDGTPSWEPLEARWIALKKEIDRVNENLKKDLRKLFAVNEGVYKVMVSGMMSDGSVSHTHTYAEAGDEEGATRKFNLRDNMVVSSEKISTAEEFQEWLTFAKIRGNIGAEIEMVSRALEELFPGKKKDINKLRYYLLKAYELEEEIEIANERGLPFRYEVFDEQERSYESAKAIIARLFGLNESRWRGWADLGEGNPFGPIEVDAGTESEAIMMSATMFGMDPLSVWVEPIERYEEI